jgi:hypothetical protein
MGTKKAKTTKVRGGGSRKDKPLYEGPPLHGHPCADCGFKGATETRPSGGGGEAWVHRVGQCWNDDGTRKHVPQDETDITHRCRAWAVDALRAERADIQAGEYPTPEQMRTMRHISQALIKLEAAHSVAQVLEIVEAHSSVMAQTMTEAMGLES